MSIQTGRSSSPVSDTMDICPVTDVPTEGDAAVTAASQSSRTIPAMLQGRMLSANSIKGAKSAAMASAAKPTNSNKRSHQEQESSCDADILVPTPAKSEKRAHSSITTAAPIAEGDVSESTQQFQINASNGSTVTPAIKNTRKEPLSTVATDAGTKNVAKSQSASASVPPSGSALPKRVKTSREHAKRRGPSFLGPNMATSANDPTMDFSTTIFKVELGEGGPSFHVHESYLIKSSVLAAEVAKAKAKRRQAQQQIITLFPHDQEVFGQLVGYLYNGDVVPNQANGGANRIERRLQEIHELMNLAKQYNLPGLQKKVVTTISKTRMMVHVSPGQFFDWAEDMYYEEMDHARGPFKQFLAKKGPFMIATASASEIKGVLASIEQGGAYAKELFVAIFTEGPNIHIKNEPVDSAQAMCTEEDLFVPTATPHVTSRHGSSSGFISANEV